MDLTAEFLNINAPFSHYVKQQKYFNRWAVDAKTKIKTLNKLQLKPQHRELPNKRALRMPSKRQ